MHGLVTLSGYPHSSRIYSGNLINITARGRVTPASARTTKVFPILNMRKFVKLGWNMSAKCPEINTVDM